ncbi:hypothetical protein ACSSZE_15885 [Acidithiobacillus caldus]
MPTNKKRPGRRSPELVIRSTNTPSIAIGVAAIAEYLWAKEQSRGQNRASLSVVPGKKGNKDGD